MSGSNRKCLRVALVGTGSISAAHLDVLAGREDVELVGLYDVSAEAAAKAAERWGTTAWSSVEEMLDGARPDAVWLCTPPFARAETLGACAQRDLPVLVEKPWAVSPQEGLALLESLPEEYRPKVQTGYLFRSLPIMEVTRRRLEADRIHYFHSCYLCGISLSRTMPGWFFLKERSGGMILDQATHNLDLLRFLLGECEQVTGFAWNPVNPKAEDYTVEEVGVATMRFAGNIGGTHSHSWVSHNWRNEIQFMGEKALYRLFPASQKLVVEDPREQLTPGTDGMNWDAERKEHTLDLSGDSMFSFEIGRFLDQVHSGDWSTNPCPPSEAQRSLEFTFAVLEGLQEWP